jgi:hypothetical protein
MSLSKSGGKSRWDALSLGHMILSSCGQLTLEQSIDSEKKKKKELVWLRTAFQNKCG